MLVHLQVFPDARVLDYNNIEELETEVGLHNAENQDLGWCRAVCLFNHGKEETRLAVGCGDGCIRIFADVSMYQECIHCISSPLSTDGIRGLSACEWLSDTGYRMCSASDCSIHVCSLSCSEDVLDNHMIFEHENASKCMCVCSCGNIVAGGFHDGSVMFVTVGPLPSSTFTLQAHSSCVQSICFVSSGAVVTGSLDGTMCVLSTLSGVGILQRIEGEHANAIHAVCAGSGGLVATGGGETDADVLDQSKRKSIYGMGMRSDKSIRVWQVSLQANSV